MPRAAAVALLWLTLQPACHHPAQELARGQAGVDGPRALVEALADRFGPTNREPAFDALRPRLAHAVLVPSRIFDDAAAWMDRGNTFRAVEFTGAAAGDAYRMGVRAHAPPPGAPSAYRGRVQLERLSGGRFEWSVDEELAVGRVRPSDLASALEALFRGAEGTSEATARAAVAEALPRASARLGLLLHLETLVLQHDAQGATAVRLAVRLTPAGIRGLAPRYAAFLQTYATPIRMRLLVAEPAGVAWWSLDGSDNLWTLHLRLRGGSLVPLEGQADRRVPPHLRATIDYSTRMGRFNVGASRLVAEVALTSTGIEKGFSARFLQEPSWQLPFLAESLLHGPLYFPFEGPGSEAGWAARETPEGYTRFVRRYRVRVRETWILRWLGGMASTAVNDFRSGAEAEADRFQREWLLALRDDLAALLPAP
ncbi:MAG TPA: hypothetical protein PKU70_00530 [Vicinamibacteria bacterium]|nr:hypothetical protein [Vicinamibacteria bacterium]HRB11470.1 hypothetical protein [Vicinamibacteria bacterium]